MRAFERGRLQVAPHAHRGMSLPEDVAFGTLRAIASAAMLYGMPEALRDALRHLDCHHNNIVIW